MLRTSYALINHPNDGNRMRTLTGGDNIKVVPNNNFIDITYKDTTYTVFDYVVSSSGVYIIQDGDVIALDDNNRVVVSNAERFISSGIDNCYFVQLTDGTYYDLQEKKIVDHFVYTVMYYDDDENVVDKTFALKNNTLTVSNSRNKILTTFDNVLSIVETDNIYYLHENGYIYRIYTVVHKRDTKEYNILWTSNKKEMKSCIAFKSHKRIVELTTGIIDNVLSLIFKDEDGDIYYVSEGLKSKLLI